MWWLFDFIGIFKRTTSESPRLLGESVSKYLHANKASVEKLWQTQKAVWDEKGVVERSLGKF